MDEEGLLYDDEGAVWLRTTEYGDDKDRVLVRQSGAPTYFLSDIAYHRDKLDRGFEHLIDIWGADHHGYVPRMKAAFTALPPHDPDTLELDHRSAREPHRERRGAAHEQAQRATSSPSTTSSTPSASTRRASSWSDAVTTRRSSSTSTWRSSSRARTRSTTCSTRTRASAASSRTWRRVARAPRRPRHAPACRELDLGPYERALVRALARFPLVVREATLRRAPHRLHAYLGELAAEFHVFYRHCRVLADEEDVAAYRVGLCRATQATLASGLRLLGVSAPESM